MSKTLNEARERIPTQKEKVLNSLRKAGESGLLNTDLLKISVRWSSRVQELYQEGYKIEHELVGNGVYRYRLISEPEVKKPKPKKATQVLIDKVNSIFDGSVTSEQLSQLLDSEGFNIVRKIGAHKLS
jgi:hypothetical protein